MVYTLSRDLAKSPVAIFGLCGWETESSSRARHVVVGEGVKDVFREMGQNAVPVHGHVQLVPYGLN